MNMDPAPPTQAKPLNEIKSRQQYVAPPLDFDSLKRSPLEQFSEWFNEAQSHGVPEPEAFSVATVDAATMTPSVRTVLLKQVDERGFCFFTNYQSRKGKELQLSPDLEAPKGSKAAGSWYWRDMHRSVRIVGPVERISEEENTKYFHSRPIGSQIGAHASPQSQVVPDRKYLEERVQKFEDEFGIEHGSAVRKADDPVDQGKNVPLPKYWGGVRIVPQEVEFWVGRPNRLHDRARYTRKSENDEWIIERLAP
ncbi:pyridoxamine 5'-phosphate oxidase [Cystobasidium minutum MCA 4210]|uniref:pyridoxamine 5'-phosphate oxidase n=1 Tax=Cystobasidium minutum MCA 4210 TaxID=1397322 RepID=UPI0034CDE8C7|eukprot:jgi/Rhomi1/174664/fgenesh1_kg.8_\